MKKFLIIALLLIVVTTIALAVFIKIYVTPEKVKELIVPLVEESLNRKVSIGEIDINVLKGIGLKDFVIKESDQKTDFLKCKEFVLKFKLMPLLSKRVIIDKLKIVSPSIRIERNKEGKYNFEDIGKKDVPKEADVAKDAEVTEEQMISLLVKKVSIQDAKFSFTDLRKELPDFKSTTDIDISMKSPDGEGIFTEGSIDITLDEAVLRKPARKEIKNIVSKIRYALYINMESEEVRIDKADIDIQKISASVKGVLKKFSTSPEIDILVNLKKVNTADIQELAALVADLKNINLSGAVTADGGDSKQGLATEMNVSAAQNFFIQGMHRADVVGPGNIPGRNHIHHARIAFYKGKIHAQNPAPGTGAGAKAFRRHGGLRRRRSLVHPDSRGLRTGRLRSQRRVLRATHRPNHDPRHPPAHQPVARRSPNRRLVVGSLGP